MRYVILLQDNTEVYVTATGMTKDLDGSLTFLFDNEDGDENPTEVACVSRGSYVYVGIEGYIE